MARSSSTSRRAEITIKISELNVTAHISAPFHVTTKTRNYNIIISRGILRKLEMQLGFQNNFIEWQDINLSMKTIDC